MKEKIIVSKNLQVWYNKKQILFSVDTSIVKNNITSIIGPSGSGKSTLLRAFNRINDIVLGYQISGDIFYKGENIYDPKSNVFDLRKEVGMLFQKPCVFPTSIEKNVLFGITNKLSKQDEKELVEKSLVLANLWKEVKDRLSDLANRLSLGQQQRLCMARTLAVKPKVILMDEPTSSLDPVSTLGFEKVILGLKKKYTIVIVTHNIDQAKKISDKVVFMCEGNIVEQGNSADIFEAPQNKKTQEYFNWNYCEC